MMIENRVQDGGVGEEGGGGWGGPGALITARRPLLVGRAHLPAALLWGPDPADAVVSCLLRTTQEQAAFFSRLISI